MHLTRQTSFAIFAIVLSVAAGGCSTVPQKMTDGRAETRAQADQEQRVADGLRREGATGAAAPAQARADKLYAKANRSPEGILEWLFDVLVNSWLYSGK